MTRETDPSQPVTVATFSSYTEAMVARASLEANGIRCFLPNANFLGVEGAGSLPMYGFLQNSAGLPLQVAAEDAEAAREVLAPVD